MKTEQISEKEVVSGTETIADIKETKTTITAKTLKAMKGYVERIVEDELLTTSEGKEFMRLYAMARQTWINKNM